MIDDGQLQRLTTIILARYEALDKEEKKTTEPPWQRRLSLEDTTIEAAQEVLRDAFVLMRRLHLTKTKVGGANRRRMISPFGFLQKLSSHRYNISLALFVSVCAFKDMIYGPSLAT